MPGGAEWEKCARIWRFRQAPPELQDLFSGGGFDQFGQPQQPGWIVFVPAALVGEDGEVDGPPDLWFLNFQPAWCSQRQFAGDDVGWYWMAELPNGGLVACTAGGQADLDSFLSGDRSPGTTPAPGSLLTRFFRRIRRWLWDRRTYQGRCALCGGPCNFPCPDGICPGCQHEWQQISNPRTA
jgi:hypothetical protein